MVWNPEDFHGRFLKNLLPHPESRSCWKSGPECNRAEILWLFPYAKVGLSVGREWDREAWDGDIWVDATENPVPLASSCSHLLAQSCHPWLETLFASYCCSNKLPQVRWLKTTHSLFLFFCGSGCFSREYVDMCVGVGMAFIPYTKVRCSDHTLHPHSFPTYWVFSGHILLFQSDTQSLLHSSVVQKSEMGVTGLKSRCP